ncbi:MAG: dehydratase [Deltaproteobacteria bacterium]|nr:dehydratase [Deltaproteobacteria bacterium]
MGLNRSFLGKQYAPQDYGVTAEAVLNYTRAYNDENPWFVDTSRAGGIMAPPMFGVVTGWLSIMMVMTDTELGVDVLRLLHSEQDMYFVRPLVPGDIITSVASIVTMTDEPAGESLTVEVQCTNQRGESVQRMLFTALIRGRSARARKRTPVAEAAPMGEPLWRVRQTIDTDQTFRYASASGDHNPIHVDENVAKMAGLPGIVVHGLCTMAFTSKVMIDQLCAGDPRKLRRLRARFSRPVFPGQEITTAVWPVSDHGGANSYIYETYNPEGKDVIREGVVKVGE